MWRQITNHILLISIIVLLLFLPKKIDLSNVSFKADKNNVKDKLFNCSRCKGNNFSISIKYEYPDEDELKELGFKDISNAFTWITVSLTCNNCGKKYKKFIDFES